MGMMLMGEPYVCRTCETLGHIYVKAEVSGFPPVPETDPRRIERAECEECGEERVHVYYRTLPEDYAPRFPEEWDE